MREKTRRREEGEKERRRDQQLDVRISCFSRLKQETKRARERKRRIERKRGKRREGRNCTPDVSLNGFLGESEKRERKGQETEIRGRPKVKKEETTPATRRVFSAGEEEAVRLCLSPETVR